MLRDTTANLKLAMEKMAISFMLSATLNSCGRFLLLFVINASIIVKIFKWQFKHTQTEENFIYFSSRENRTKLSSVFCVGLLFF